MWQCLLLTAGVCFHLSCGKSAEWQTGWCQQLEHNYAWSTSQKFRLNILCVTQLVSHCNPPPMWSPEWQPVAYLRTPCTCAGPFKKFWKVINWKLINSKVSLSGQTDVSEVQLWYWVGESPLSESKLLMAAQFWFHHIPVWFPHGSRKGIQQKVLKHCKKIPLHRLACPEC